jgi:drug/metabolite transporter (DMT)-like permease
MDEQRHTHSQPPFDVADGAMLATALIWAGNNVLVKRALEDLAPLSYVFGRFAIVVVLLFLWLRLRRTNLRVRRADVGLFILAGVTGFTLFNVLFAIGLDHTSVFSVSILVNSSPIFALVIVSLLGIERVRPGQWFGVACAWVGIAVFVGDKLRGDVPAWGDLLSLLAAAAFAVYSLAVWPLNQRYRPPVVTAWSALVGLVTTIPIAASTVVRQDWGAVSFPAWGALFYSAVISMLISYTIWGWAIERRGLGRPLLYLYLVPIFAGIIAALFLDETFGPFKIAGAALVLAGVGLAHRSGGRSLREIEIAERRPGGGGEATVRFQGSAEEVDVGGDVDVERGRKLGEV